MSLRRAVPHPGAPVTVVDLDARVAGTVLEVSDGGRRLVVETEDGTRRTFTLRRATAVFTAAADSAWPRLVFDL